MTFLTFLTLICALVFPALIVRARNRKFISVLGISGTAYVGGLSFALCRMGLQALGLGGEISQDACEILAYVSISLAIPLLLFSNPLSLVRRLSRRSLLCFGLLVVAAVTATVIVYFGFSHTLENGVILSGMAVALYTGGTPNLNAVAGIFGLPADQIVMANLSDVVFGGMFYVFLLFAAKPFVCRVMKMCTVNGDSSKGKEEFWQGVADRKVEPKNAKGIVCNVLLSLGIVALCAGGGIIIWVLRGKTEGTLINAVVPALMVGTTLGGIAGSLAPRVRTVPQNDTVGQYFAAVFGFAIAAVLSPQSFGSHALRIFAAYACITTGTFLLHALLCKLCRIDADEMIVTATAGIYGPAFIPGICNAIGAKDRLPTGLVLGSLGYAIGTFLGTVFIRIFLLFV